MNKKSIFKTYIEDTCSDYFLNDLGYDCMLGDNILIDPLIFFTGSEANSVLSITVNPTKGNAELIDNKISYTNSSGSDGEIDSIEILVTVGSCTYSNTITILLTDELTPLPVYNMHSATRQINGELACSISGALNATIYTDGVTLLGSSLIYSDVNGTTRAPAGYYRIGSVSRYWSGTMFGNTYNC